MIEKSKWLTHPIDDNASWLPYFEDGYYGNSYYNVARFLDLRSKNRHDRGKMVARHAILSWYFHVITASIHGIVVVEEEEAQRVGVEKVPIIVSPFPFLEEHVSIQSETATLLTVKEKIFFSQKRY